MKEKLLNKLNLLIDEKIKSLETSIESTIESRDLYTKSSAGDKHETSRAMMQIELENLSRQLNKNKVLKYELSKIDVSKKYNEVDLGALVISNQGNYFISIGWGKINIDTIDYYCISLGSPIGKKLYNKKEGDSFLFLQKTSFIKTIF